MPPLLLEEATRSGGPRSLETGGRVVGREPGHGQDNLQSSLAGRGGCGSGPRTLRGVVTCWGSRLTAVFTHLHVRSGFSYGFGTSTPEELTEATGKMGVASIALTDRDGLYGIPRFLRAAGERGIEPIVGAEVGLEGGHLVLLVEHAKGYRSLSKLITSYRCS